MVRVGQGSVTEKKWGKEVYCGGVLSGVRGCIGWGIKCGTSGARECNRVEVGY